MFPIQQPSNKVEDKEVTLDTAQSKQQVAAARSRRPEIKPWPQSPSITLCTVALFTCETIAGKNGTSHTPASYHMVLLFSENCRQSNRTTELQRKHPETTLGIARIPVVFLYFRQCNKNTFFKLMTK